MAQHDLLYQRAVYYDIALSRDVSTEIDFIQQIYRHLTGSELTSVLDLACGPGYHARCLARRGIRAVGLDLFTPMIDLAKEHALQEKVTVEWIVNDMRCFKLAKPVDMAICMFDGIDALVDNDDFICHLQTVSANLIPGGLYLLDCTHPRDCSFGYYGDYRYSGKRNGISVDIIWSTNRPSIDPVTGVAEVELELHVDDHGNRQIIKDKARERCLTAQEIQLLVRLSGVFDIAGWYGGMDLKQPLDNTPLSTRMISVLRKR